MYSLALEARGFRKGYSVVICEMNGVLRSSISVNNHDEVFFVDNLLNFRGGGGVVFLMSPFPEGWGCDVADFGVARVLEVEFSKKICRRL